MGKLKRGRGGKKFQRKKKMLPKQEKDAPSKIP